MFQFITMTDKDLKSLKISKRNLYKDIKNGIKISLVRKFDNDSDIIIISSPPNTHLKLLKNIKNSNLFMIENLCVNQI